MLAQNNRQQTKSDSHDRQVPATERANDGCLFCKSWQSPGQAACEALQLTWKFLLVAGRNSFKTVKHVQMHAGEQIPAKYRKQQRLLLLVALLACRELDEGIRWYACQVSRACR